MEEIKEKKKRSPSFSRVKGHVAERLLAKEFRDLGYPDCATTRASSRMLDNAKIDLNFIPYNVQSKAVIKNLTYGDYCTLLDEVTNGIKALPKELHNRLEYPTVVMHKKDRQTLVVMTKEDFYKIVKQLPK
jgi:hypothetical protein